jgi:gliding motility-associated-like protein
MDTTICANQPVKLGGDSLTPNATYTWFPSSTLDNPFVPNPIARPTASITTYSVTVVAPGTGCTNTGFVVVTMLNPLIANPGVNEQICLNDSVGIGAGLIEGQFYHWTPSTGLSSTTIPNPVASPTETTTYTLVVTDTAGCPPVTDNVTVTVNPLPNANAGVDDTIPVGGSVQLTGTGGVQYYWTPSAGLNNANIFDPIASPDSTTNYVLTVTNIFGCQSTDTMQVFVFGYAQPWWIPTAFTPNGDGHNDVLYVRGGGFMTFEFQVFDRYGELMFDSKNINTGWEGTTLTGQPAPLDAYVYRLNGTLNDGTKVDTKGLVNLVR